LDPGTTFDQLPSRADFVEAFLVNDDQRGTHLRMPIKPGSTVGETPYDFRTNVRYIIIALPQKVYITGEIAEQLGWPNQEV
jgi:hypothetical protein